MRARSLRCIARPSDEAQDLTHRLSEALQSAELVDAAQLCILEARASRLDRAMCQR